MEMPKSTNQKSEKMLMEFVESSPLILSRKNPNLKKVPVNVYYHIEI